MSGTKRAGDPLKDDDLDLDILAPAKKATRPADEFQLGDDEPSPWPDMLNTILGVMNGRQDSESHASDGISNETSCGALIVNVLSNASPEQSALANFDRRIEKWAEKTVNSFDTEASQELESTACYQALSPDPDSVQCFGMLHGCEARLINNMQDFSYQLERMALTSKWAAFQLRFDSNISFLALDDHTICGQLRDGLYDPLQQISKGLSARLVAYVLIHDCLKVIYKAKRLHEAVIKVDINVYGASSARAKIGRILSLGRLYLQHPRCGKDEYEYRNPHMLAYDDINLEDESKEREPGPLQFDNAQEIQQTIFDVCDMETRDADFQENIDEVDTDTTLYPHQTRAVEFMVEREIGPIPDSRKLWQYTLERNRSGFRHVVTELWTEDPHEETGGGLLADDMGMGKTLSTLCLIVKRLPEARVWSQWERDEVNRVGKSSRSAATLVVVPSLLILNGWQKEIEEGLNTSLKFFKYHGKRRLKSTQFIFDNDIILTTYHTLAAERRSKKSPLKPIHWYRIVLDEAHTARRQATGLFAAVAELEAQYRWCLSGTPIQNNLNDLGALLAFLRVDPFDSNSVFRKYIVNTFSHDSDAAKAKLSSLLNSVCIRRKRERLKLPPMEEKSRTVDFSAQERLQYDRTRESMSYILSHGSRDKYSGTPFGRFQIQLQLRRLCNHGTFQRPFTNPREDLQTQKEDLLSSVGKDGEIECSSCHEKTLILATNCAATRELPSCTHVLCIECMSVSSEPASRSQAASACPYCVAHEPNESLPSRANAITFPNRPDFLASGYSAKMEALMKDVKERLDKTKSIIFSSWTRSLDLVQLHLAREGIAFTRIDGDTEPNKRQKILDDFGVSKEISVLLMTTGTGAYGLNLTVANRIFILEPQWNPSIETQAIARAQRLRQEQSVQVIRYIVKDSVERDMVKQQVAKVITAEMGFRGPLAPTMFPASSKL